jgi:hypothetical protein
MRKRELGASSPQKCLTLTRSALRSLALISISALVISSTNLANGLAGEEPVATEQEVTCYSSTLADWCTRAGGTPSFIQRSVKPSLGSPTTFFLGCKCFDPNNPDQSTPSIIVSVPTRANPNIPDVYSAEGCMGYLTEICYSCFPKGGGAGNIPECAGV